MCNIAGYVGTRRAAPILIEMIKKQEGYDGGYYTGIATMHEGKIYYEKLTGDVDRLVALTKAAELPGNIGIIHSRSKSGGPDGWAHPFVGLDHGVPTMAYIANGWRGCFEADNERRKGLMEQVMNEGYQPNFKFFELDTDEYPRFSDGSIVHGSDVMCQFIHRNIHRGMKPAEAMEAAFCELPSEIVGLVLTLREQNGIVWSRINMPMFVAFAEHGAYMSSAPLAIPEDAGNSTLLQECCSGVLYQNKLEMVHYKKAPEVIPPVDPYVIHKTYELVETLLGEKEMTFSELRREVGEWFRVPQAKQRGTVMYMVLSDMIAKGRLNLETRRIKGAADGIDAPKTYFSLKK